MKRVVVGLALIALCWTLVFPLGAAMWGDPHLACGCSPDACQHGGAADGFCPHGNRIDPAARHEGGHHGAAHPQGSSETSDHCHKTPSAAKAVQVSEPGDRKGQPGGTSCEIRSCSSGPVSGIGVIPTLPQGEMLSSPAASGPDLSGSLSATPPPHPPDVFRVVELPPPKR